jgi:hypothetical protein
MQYIIRDENAVLREKLSFLLDDKSLSDLDFPTKTNHSLLFTNG